MSRVAPTLGVSEESYETLLEASDHRCWICSEPESVEGRRLALDHDHRTGAVRGLLCTSCNRKLGASVDPEWHSRAADYLRVAARAFADACRKCGKPALSFLDEVRTDGSVTYKHRCCGKKWRVTYDTKGVPASWAMSGVPVPRHVPLHPPQIVGHPGDEDCACSDRTRAADREYSALFEPRKAVADKA